MRWLSLFDSTSPLSISSFLLSVPVFLFHLELFPELLYTKDMANLRRSATKESEDTSDVFHPPTQNVPVCSSKRPPCVPAPRAHVETHVARGAGTHGDVSNFTYGHVLSGHTGFHGATQHTPHHTTHRTHTTKHKTQHIKTTRPQHHTEIERDTDRQRQKETDREEKTAEERQEKRRQNRQDRTR